MTLEEIQNLSDEELGRQLAESIGYKKKKGKSIANNREFDYWELGEKQVINFFWLCTDLTSIAEVEKIVIEKTSFTDYGRCLVGVTECHGIGLDSLARIATATARQRAIACLLALQS